MYQIAPDYMEISSKYVIRIRDNAWIPPDPANTDYQAYLAWLEEGNTPLPADEPNTSKDQ